MNPWFRLKGSRLGKIRVIFLKAVFDLSKRIAQQAELTFQVTALTALRQIANKDSLCWFAVAASFLFH